MKWEAIDTKTDVAFGTTRAYKLLVEVTKENNTLTVVVNAQKAPWKVKPTTWSGVDIKKILTNKGFKINKIISQPTLNNSVANSKTYIFELVSETKKKTTETQIITKATTGGTDRKTTRTSRAKKTLSSNKNNTTTN